MSVLGRWMFLSTIVPGLAAYLRSGFQCVRGCGRREYVGLSRAFRMDLAFLRQLAGDGSLTVSMVRRPLTSGFASWDACTGWGFGAYLDGAFFAVAWADLLRGEHGAVDALFPLRAPRTEHVDYLELFACYRFLRVWGGRLRGVCVVCQCTDSSALHGVSARRLFG